ncbi:MAG: NUDIX hydrolase [Thermodesulfobacteriota bacterium]
MKRHYPDQPLVGVGAVVFRGEEVLLVLRGQEPALGVWSLPGGLVELGETLEAAIQRELAEEVGITVKILGITAVLERIYRDTGDGVTYHYVLVDFLCDYVDGEARPASDITGARFVPLTELEQFDLPEFTARVIKRAWEQKREGGVLPLIMD